MKSVYLLEEAPAQSSSHREPGPRGCMWSRRIYKAIDRHWNGTTSLESLAH